MFCPNCGNENINLAVDTASVEVGEYNECSKSYDEEWNITVQQCKTCGVKFLMNV